MLNVVKWTGLLLKAVIYLKKPVSAMCMENIDLDCYESYCWEACEYFKDLSKQDFELVKITQTYVTYSLIIVFSPAKNSTLTKFVLTVLFCFRVHFGAPAIGEHVSAKSGQQI